MAEDPFGFACSLHFQGKKLKRIWMQSILLEWQQEQGGLFSVLLHHAVREASTTTSVSSSWAGVQGSSAPEQEKCPWGRNRGEGLLPSAPSPHCQGIEEVWVWSRPNGQRDLVANDEYQTYLWCCIVLPAPNGLVWHTGRILVLLRHHCITATILSVHQGHRT